MFRESLPQTMLYTQPGLFIYPVSELSQRFCLWETSKVILWQSWVHAHHITFFVTSDADFGIVQIGFESKIL